MSAHAVTKRNVQVWCVSCSAAIKPGQALVEVAVLASQPLTALRDAIHCEADANLASQQQSRPAGFFYIEVSSALLPAKHICSCNVLLNMVHCRSALSTMHNLLLAPVTRKLLLLGVMVLCQISCACA